MIDPTSDDRHIWLIMKVGAKYGQVFEFFRHRDDGMNVILFTRLFEDSHHCGSSGIVSSITEIKIGQKEETENQTVPGRIDILIPIMALTTSTLDHYEFLRRQTSTQNGRKHPYPEFIRMGC